MIVADKKSILKIIFSLSAFIIIICVIRVLILYLKLYADAHKSILGTDGDQRSKFK